MGAARQPSQYVFGADDGERKAFQGPVQRRYHHQAGWLEQRGAAIHEQREVGDMLDHLHRQNDVEALARIDLFHRDVPVVDRQGRAAGMQLRRGDIGLRRIDSDHLRAQPRQRFAQQSGAAADIQHAQAREAAETLGVAAERLARRVADIAQPQRIDPVQRRHLALGIPPFLGQFRKPRDLGGIDGRGRPGRGRLRDHGSPSLYRAVM